MARVNKSAGIEAAKIAGLSTEMTYVANQVEAKARARAAGHGSLPGRISSKTVRGKRGVMDRLVSLEHPEAGNIEFGHIDVRTGKWVKGLWIMRNAYEDM